MLRIVTSQVSFNVKKEGDLTISNLENSNTKKDSISVIAKNRSLSIKQSCVLRQFQFLIVVIRKVGETTVTKYEDNRLKPDWEIHFSYFKGEYIKDQKDLFS